jgi:hypothetical protein
VEVLIENVLSIVLTFIISWVRMDVFPVGCRPIIIDEFLRNYTYMVYREEITSLVTGLLDERGRFRPSPRDLVFRLTGGLNGWKRVATHKDFT